MWFLEKVDLISGSPLLLAQSRGQGQGPGRATASLVWRSARPFTSHVTVPPVRSPPAPRCLCRIRACGASHCCTVVGYRCAGGVRVLWGWAAGAPRNLPLSASVPAVLLYLSLPYALPLVPFFIKT